MVRLLLFFLAALSRFMSRESVLKEFLSRAEIEKIFAFGCEILLLSELLPVRTSTVCGAKVDVVVDVVLLR